MNIPNELKYTTKDEWLRVEGNVGTIGITDYAQDQLSDVIFAEILVDVGDEVDKGDSLVTLESVKAASDVYAPVSGKVLAINIGLPDAPETVNSDPYGAAWMVKLELSNPQEISQLLDAAGYEAQLASKE
jgi:glycine cleavage system H protein